MSRVIDFHRKSSEGRAAFRTAVSGLVEEIKDIKDPDFFQKRLQKFDEDLSSSQKSLASILQSGGADIGYASITTGIPITLASIGFIGMTGDPWSMSALGQSAFLGVTALLADHARSRRNLWTTKESSYWLSLNSAFKSEDGVRLKIPQFHRNFEEFIND